MFSASSPPITSLLYPKACKFGQSKPNSKRFFSVRASLPVSDHNLKVEYTPWLIVGLGNPGTKYHGTRHNIGFEMIDQIARTRDISMNTIQSKALVGMGAVGEVPILLVKPQAYMNFSGESVGPLAAYYQVPLRHILMIYDDMGLPNGVLKLQPRGGHSHHNGLKNVTEHLNGCRGFPRLSIGIGNPPGNMDMKAFLLQKFSPLERKQIDVGMEQGVEAVRTLVEDGFNDTISRFNLEQKYKFHTV
uniref:Chloroplastic group IIB intron splicing facilitator CRS2-A, chloroplastic n=1 Tax=Noccaea caerulescens TaxID=107243 RepID=A0A1J3E754_NOCCA